MISGSTQLTDDAISRIRELRRLNVDSAKGFEECAGIVQNMAISSAFVDIASRRRAQAEELGQLVAANEGPEDEEGSYVAAMHRAWIKTKEALSSDDLGVVLTEAERGEDAIKEAYEDALQELSGCPACDTLRTQYAEVKAVHDRIRDLRDAHNG